MDPAPIVPHVRERTLTPNGDAMSVGLPGTGVGALFYLLSALWAPIHRLIRRDEHRSRGIAVAAIALVIVAVVALATVAINIALPEAQLRVVDVETASGGEGFTITPLVLVLLLSPFGTLALILLTVRIAAAIVRRSDDAPDELGDAIVDEALIAEQIEVAS
jgi:hypothetical protein